MIPEVRVDGVLYVPVTESNPNYAAIEHALVSQWAGEDWRAQYPDAPTYLRVDVGDGFALDEGESIPEFIARILASGVTSEA